MFCLCVHSGGKKTSNEFPSFSFSHQAIQDLTLPDIATHTHTNKHLFLVHSLFLPSLSLSLCSFAPLFFLSRCPSLFSFHFLSSPFSSLYHFFFFSLLSLSAISLCHPAPCFVDKCLSIAQNSNSCLKFELISPA